MFNRAGGYSFYFAVFAMGEKLNFIEKYGWVMSGTYWGDIKVNWGHIIMFWMSEIILIIMYTHCMAYAIIFI